MRLFFYILIFTILLGCKAKYITQNNMPSGYESFDINEYDSNNSNYFKNNNYIKMNTWNGNYIMTIYPNNSYYNLYKEFYKNGNIKEKGLLFGSIEIGIWEYYNENGTLVEKKDKDKNFNPNFDYNDIINYLHKRGSINKYRKKIKEQIKAIYVKSKNLWSVSVYYNKTKEGNNADKAKEYVFDKNGKVLEKHEKVTITRGY